MASSTNPPPVSEKNFLGRELPYRSLYIAVAAVLVTCVVFAILLIPMVQGFRSWTDKTHDRARTGPAPAAERPVGPLLQAKPEDQLIDYDREMDAELEQYGWIDEGAGIVQIPLARARELVLAEGLPSTASPAADAPPAEEVTEQ